MAKYTANEDNLAEMLENLIDILGQAGKIFESSKPEVQNEFLRILVSNSVLEGEKVRISLQKPFEKLLGNPDYLLWLESTHKLRTHFILQYILVCDKMKKNNKSKKVLFSTPFDVVLVYLRKYLDE